MQAAINEVARHIHQPRPLDGVGADECDMIFAEQCDKFRNSKGIVSYLDCMTYRLVKNWLRHASTLHASVVFFRQPRRLFRVVRKQREKVLQKLRLIAEVG